MNKKIVIILSIILVITIILYIFDNNKNSQFFESFDLIHNFVDRGNQKKYENNLSSGLALQNLPQELLDNLNYESNTHLSLNKLNIWNKFASGSVQNIVSHGNYIYAVSKDKKIYRAIMTGGITNNVGWTKIIDNGAMIRIQVTNDYIYGINDNMHTYYRNVNGSGNWEKFGQDGFKTTQIVVFENFVYGIGLDSKIYSIPLKGEKWTEYTPGYVRHISIYNRKIYAIGLNMSIFVYPIITPPVPLNPLCKLIDNKEIWTTCNGKKTKKWLSVENLNPIDQNMQIVSCNVQSQAGAFNKCPINHTEKWKRLGNFIGAPMLKIHIHNDIVFGLGTDLRLHVIHLTGGLWLPFLTSKPIKDFIINNGNYLYAIGSDDNNVHIHGIDYNRLGKILNIFKTINNKKNKNNNK